MGKQKPKTNLPLEGIKVIDAASFIAGPVVSALMSDYGAEVVKIEPPSGDSYRNVYKGSDLWPENLDQWEFLLENRNKRSLAVDLKSSEGQIIVERLIMQSDVFITNLPFKPRLQLGLTASRVRELNSRIIYASLTGYGEKGSDSERNALDATAWWARSGMMDWSTSNLPNAQPPYPIPGAGDHPTGISLLSSILLALINRQKTDEGTTVSTSLLANGIWSNSVLIQSILAGNHPVESFHWDELGA